MELIKGGIFIHKILKGLLIITMIVISISTTPNVTANSGPPVIGITILPDVCEEVYIEETDEYSIVFPNNFDILVQIDDFKTDDFGEMKGKYKTLYPFYEDIDYLIEMETGWTSYSAYYHREGLWNESFNFCGIEFGSNDDVAKMETFVLVYFDDNGDTLFMSEEIDVPSVYFYQDRESVIYFNTTTFIMETQLDPTFDPYFIFTVILILLLIVYSVVIELAVAIIFKLKTKKILLNIILINAITQIAMYIYFYLIFNPHGNSYIEHLFFYEIFVLVIEFAYLYWRFKTVISLKRLMLYVLISNIVSYALGVMRYM
jgi:hypothetical protein